MAKFPMKPPVIIVQQSVPAEPEEPAESGDGGAGFSTRWLFWRAVLWLLIVFGVQTLASLMPTVVETVYSGYIYYYIPRYLSVVNKLVSFSIGELLFFVLLSWFAGWFLWYLRRAWRKETKLLDVLKVLFLHIVWLMSAGFAIFLLMWGLNYQRPPLGATLKLDQRPAGMDEMEKASRLIVDGLNRNFSRAHEGANANATGLTISRTVMYQVIEKAFQNERMLGDASQGGFGNPKPLIVSRLASMAGIYGIYIPYTAEATFNEQIPDVDLPFTIAHEKAHQRGYAREDEANFIAFVVCIKASDPNVCYSGYVHGLKVLDSLAKADPSLAETIRRRIAPGPDANLRARAEFWKEAKSSSLDPITKRVLSMYLRSNRVAGGVKNYNEDTPLIASYLTKVVDTGRSPGN